LRKYPLPLKTGKECIILEGFGDKICKMLDEKLKPFLDEGGVLHESNNDENVELIDDDYNKQAAYSEATSKSKSKKLSKSNKNCDFVCLDDEDDDQSTSELPNTYLKQIQAEKSTSSSKLILMGKKSKSDVPKSSKSSKKDNTSNRLNNESDDFREDDDSGLNEKNKKRSKAAASSTQSKRTKEYVPEFRSGAYALLITLLNHENENRVKILLLIIKVHSINNFLAKKDSENKFMFKNQLIKEAQKHCDSSFTSVNFYLK
jgi:hypothetical protein